MAFSGTRLLVGLASLFLLALAEHSCQRRLVGGLNLLVLVADERRGQRMASWLYVAHVTPTLLLVFDREPDLPVRGVGRVGKILPQLRRQHRPTAAHLLRVQPCRPRHGRDRDPLRIHMLVVREGDVGVRQRHAVLQVPPRLVHRDVHMLARPAGRRRRGDDAGVEWGLALVLEGAGHGTRLGFGRR
ncbi:hypothetical protein D1007_04794 [Hordeum vulgare]|nr:hypothetical protein D1007_04794 [Hordeum vulgare]